LRLCVRAPRMVIDSKAMDNRERKENECDCGLKFVKMHEKGELRCFWLT
jgi:hypothetical protein